MTADFRLEVENLSVEFPASQGSGWLRAVRDLDLELEPGEFVGLVGESGSGKSVAALTCLGLTPQPGRVAGGRVLVGGEDLAGMNQRRLQQIRGGEIGFVFQEPMTALNPVLTIGFQIREAIRAHRDVSRSEAREAAIALLRDVALPNPEKRAKSYPHELSGGQRQRVMIAIALAAEPSLLLADEPTTALDVTIQGQILELFQHLREERGLGILLITHDLGVVAQTCDRVVVMYAGEVVEEASATALFSQPRHPYTEALLRALPSIDSRSERMQAIPGSIPSLAEVPPGCSFAPRCEQVFDRCRETHPPRYGCGDDRTSRCFLEDPQESYRR